MPTGDKRGRIRTVRRAQAKVDELEELLGNDLAEIYEKPVHEWDWEELSHGCPRKPNGSFPSKRPAFVTQIVLSEAQRRMRMLTERQLMTHAQQAIRVLTDLMKCDDLDITGKPVVPASVRMDAAKYIINHVIGIPKARTETDESNPLGELLAGILVNPDGKASHDNSGIVIDMEEDEEGEDGEG